MSRGIVVSDTSPIRALEFLGLLDVLTELFDEVLIPPAVRDELLRPRKRFRAIDAGLIRKARVQAPTDERRVEALTASLQIGEAQAIALAEELDADLLIDEMAGRSVARGLGLRITGAVGILVEAKKQGHIPNVVPLLHRLRDELGFFLSDQLIEDARRESGE